MPSGLPRKLKSWGFDAKIESFDVLFPTPKERCLEMIEPVKFVASSSEPVVAGRSNVDQQKRTASRL